MASPSNAESSEAGRNPHGPGAAELALVEAHCSLCGAHAQRAEAYGYDFEYNTAANPFRFVRCADCGHLYLSPRPAPADLPVIYPANYYTLAGTGSLVAKLRRLWEGKKVRIYRGALGDGKKRISTSAAATSASPGTARFGPKEWELVGVDFDPTVGRCRAAGSALAKRVRLPRTEPSTRSSCCS